MYLKKSFIVFIIFSLYTSEIHSQEWDIQKYKMHQKYALSKIDSEKGYIENVIRQSDSLYSIPRFILKSKGKVYKCYNDIYDFIDFDKDSLYQRILIFKEKTIIGSIEPIIDKYPIKYLYSDFNFDKDEYYKITSKSDCDFFEIEGLEGDLWCIKNRIVFKIKVGCLNTIKLEPSSKYIAKKYGKDYFNDVINDKVKIGKYYLLCE